MKKFKASFCGKSSYIEIVEIERESPSSVWVNGRRHAKISDYESYFDGFVEAKEFLAGQANRSIKQAEDQLAYHRESLVEIMFLKP